MAAESAHPDVTKPVEQGTPRSGTVLPWVRAHPAPRFLVTGGLATVVDFGSLRAFHGLLALPLALATALAFLAAFVVNFTLSRHWTFGYARGGRVRRQVQRYTLLVIVNLGLTVLIVTGLADLGLNYLAAKLVATVLISVSNFFLYRGWVFV